MFNNKGDITKIDGSKVEPVDCVIGGSPCTSFSVAGSRDGFDGQSGLFLHQIRLVREMREKSNFLKPRFMVLENVVGILSCTNGKDFQRVLKECVHVAATTSFRMEKGRNSKENDNKQITIPDVPMPKNGKWPKSGILYDEMGRWSLAWRVHDAQYWGVAQRRRRIALVVDFGGLSAPKVLFEPEGITGNPDQSDTQGERTTKRITGGITESDSKSNRQGIENSIPIVLDRASYNQGVNARYDPSIEKSETVPTLVSRGPSAVCYDSRGNGDGKVTFTLTGDHDNRITDYTNVIVENNKTYCINGDAHESGISVLEESAHTLKTTTKESVFCIGNGQSHVTQHFTEEIAQTLNCMHDPMTIIEPRLCDDVTAVHGQSYPAIFQKKSCYYVRRLTPLECTRLQGFPDHWVDIGDWIDSKGKKHKETDSAKYKALGNSIALPFWKWLCKNIVDDIRYNKHDSEYIPTMASLFAGIGGFDLCWLEATGTKESIRWVSEIDEFPIAVLKHHFI